MQEPQSTELPRNEKTPYVMIKSFKSIFHKYIATTCEINKWDKNIHFVVGKRGACAYLIYMLPLNYLIVLAYSVFLFYKYFFLNRGHDIISYLIIVIAQFFLITYQIDVI